MLLEIEGPQVLPNNFGHAHTQRGGKILDGHFHLAFRIFQ